MQSDVPTSVEEQEEFNDPAKLEHIATEMDERFGGWQPRERRKSPHSLLQDLKGRVAFGETTGSAALDRSLKMSTNALVTDANDAAKIPTIAARMAQQADTHPHPIRRRRPNLFLTFVNMPNSQDQC